MNAELAHELIDRIYTAALEPERWQDFVDELAGALGGAAVVLAFQLPDSEVSARTFLAHLRPIPSNVLMHAVEGGLPLLPDAKRVIQANFTPMDELISVEALPRYAFCAEWMEPQGLIPFGGLGYCFASENHDPTALIAILERRGGRRFGRSDWEFCDLLAPHLVCAYQLHQRARTEERANMALSGVMDRLPAGLVLLDRELRLVLTNRSADHIVALDDGLTLGADGPRLANLRDDVVLRAILSDLVSGKRGAADGESVMAISRPSGAQAFPLLIGRLADTATGEVAADAIISLIVGDPEAGQSISPDALRAAYDLTPAESDLVGILAAGSCLAEAAEMRGVSLNTVRTQLKHVFAKTDTHHQGELIRLVLTGSAAFQ